MLQRSPKSKIYIALSVSCAVIAVTLFMDSLLSLKELSNKYGERRAVLIANKEIEYGERILDSEIVSHEMFVSDMPPNALRTKNSFNESVSLNTIKPGTILTSEMIGESIDEDLQDFERIVFIPTEEVLDPRIAKFTDVISFTPDGFTASIIASKSRILFNHSNYENSEVSTNGYWLVVSSDEALSISQALSTGNVTLALVKH